MAKFLLILKAIFNEHIDGWKIEINRVKNQALNPFGFHPLGFGLPEEYVTPEVLNFLE